MVRKLFAALIVISLTVFFTFLLFTSTFRINQYKHDTHLNNQSIVESNIYDQLMESTVQVRAYVPSTEPLSKSSTFHSGTGWIMHGKDGTTFVWTAGHVAVGARKEPEKWNTIRVYSKLIEDGEDKNKDTYKEAKVLAISHCVIDSIEDFAVLVLENEKRYRKSSVFLLNEDEYPKLGDTLILAGSSGGPSRGIFISQGTLGRRGIKLANFQFDNCNMPALPGCSGGPIVDIKGRVVGAIMAGRSECHGYFAPSKRIRDWAKHMNIEYTLNPSLDVPVTMIPKEEVITERLKSSD